MGDTLENTPVQDSCTGTSLMLLVEVNAVADNGLKRGLRQVRELLCAEPVVNASQIRSRLSRSTTRAQTTGTMYRINRNERSNDMVESQEVLNCGESKMYLEMICD